MVDDDLISLGKQIKAVENEMKKDAEEKSRVWGSTVKPKLEKQIEELVRRRTITPLLLSYTTLLLSHIQYLHHHLDITYHIPYHITYHITHHISISHIISHIVSQVRKCTVLRNRLDVESRKGLEHVARLEEELRPLTDQLETAKKQLYFPTR